MAVSAGVETGILAGNPEVAVEACIRAVCSISGLFLTKLPEKVKAAAFFEGRDGAPPPSDSTRRSAPPISEKRRWRGLKSGAPTARRPYPLKRRVLLHHGAKRCQRRLRDTKVPPTFALHGYGLAKGRHGAFASESAAPPTSLRGGESTPAFCDALEMGPTLNPKTDM